LKKAEEHHLLIWADPRSVLLESASPTIGSPAQARRSPRRSPRSGSASPTTWLINST
jgi:hypothetical protein